MSHVKRQKLVQISIPQPFVLFSTFKSHESVPNPETPKIQSVKSVNVTYQWEC